MRKVTLFAVIASVCLIGTIAYAAPFAAQLDTSAPNLLSGGSVDLEFTLSEDATTVTVQVIGPLPGSTVQRTFNMGALSRGDHSVAWDGKNQSAVDVALGGYKFTVKAESAGYGSSWTNITPLAAHDLLSTGTTELGIADTANIRGIGFNGTNIIIAGTTPIGLFVVNSSGEYQHNLGLTVVDTYDADDDGYTTDTWNLNAWLGPYDVATATDGSVYVGTYRGAGFPISRIEADDAASSPVAVAFQAGNSRAMDVVNAGANTIIYEGGNAGSAATRVHTSTDGTTFSLLESTAAMPNSHMVIGRDGNTAGDGDVLWCSTNSGYVERWVRSGGSWAQDTAFSGPANACGGDYARIGGKDVIAVIDNSTNDIVFADGDTGTQLDSWSPPGSRSTYGGNGDLTIVQVGAADYDVYFALPDFNIFGKIRYGGIGDLQYWTASGLACVEDQTSEAFGYMFVGSSYPASSSNPGATADQQGMYILKCDGTFYGGSASAAYAAADNNPSANWDSGDNWSPYRAKAGVDDNVITQGDWGTAHVTDDVMMYYGVATGTTARQMLLAGGSNHGRIYAAMTRGTGSAKQLVGLDRDDNYGQDMFYWDIGETIDNYTGAKNLLIDGPSITGSSLIYSMKDFIIGPSGNIYLANSRWSAQQDKLDCVNSTGDAIVWLKTGDDLATDSLGAFHQNNYTYSIDYSEDKDWVALLERSTNPDVVVYSNAGVFQSTFSVDTGIATSYHRNLCFVPAGNLWIADNNTEHTWIWAPPGASNYTTTLWDAVYFGPTPIPTPSPTPTATPSPTPTPTGLENWPEY